jgi:hypothetical protein
MASKIGLGISLFILAWASLYTRDDITMLPTYDSIVVDVLRVHKDIVSYEQVPLDRAGSRAEFVRIVDIRRSPPQSTDKGSEGRYFPAGDEDIHESTYSR